MSSRLLEVFILGLLIVTTLGLGFQFQNQRTLERIHDELREYRLALAEVERTQAQVAAAAPQPPHSQGYAPPQSGGLQDAWLTRRPLQDPLPEAGISDAPRPAPQHVATEPAPQDDAEPEPQSQTQPADEPETTATATASAEAADPRVNDLEAQAEEVVSAEVSSDAAALQETRVESAAEAEQPDEAWEHFEEHVVAAIEQMLTGNYDAVYERFARNMQRSLTRGDFAEGVAPFRESHGGFVEIASYENITSDFDDGMYVFRVVAETESERALTFTITLDEQERIAGLLLR